MGITGTVPALEPVYEYKAGERIADLTAICVGADDRVYQAQATSWSRMPAIGVVRAGVEAGEAVEVYQSGKISNVSRTEDFEMDAPIYVSATAGKLTAVPVEGVGNIIQEVGRSWSSSDIVLNIQPAIELG